jgi:hypothetical protein
VIINVCTVLGWPKAPPLLPEVSYELELHGVDSVRSWLVVQSDTRREYLGRLGNAVLRYGEAEDWLKWKAEKEMCWIKIGVVAAVAAAIFSLVAVVK